MQRVAVEFPQTAKGNLHVLVAADYFIQWVKAYAIPHQKAVTEASKLVDKMLCQFSIPEQLHSDQGRQFESSVMQEVCRIFKIHKTRTTSYHLQSDGLIERFNRTLINMLATTVGDHPMEWECHLSKLCVAYNTDVPRFTPFYLMFRRQAKLPIDVVYSIPSPGSDSVEQYTVDLRKSLQEAYRNVQARMNAVTKREKECYNQKAHGDMFEAMDLVLLHNLQRHEVNQGNYAAHGLVHSQSSNTSQM